MGFIFRRHFYQERELGATILFLPGLGAYIFG
jgi:hypothetical protein